MMYKTVYQSPRLQQHSRRYPYDEPNLFPRCILLHNVSFKEMNGTFVGFAYSLRPNKTKRSNVDARIVSYQIPSCHMHIAVAVVRIRCVLTAARTNVKYQFGAWQYLLDK